MTLSKEHDFELLAQEILCDPIAKGAYLKSKSERYRKMKFNVKILKSYADVFSCIVLQAQGFPGNYSGNWCVGIRAHPDDREELFLWLGVPPEKAVIQLSRLMDKLAGICKVHGTILDLEVAKAVFILTTELATIAKNMEIVPDWCWEAAEKNSVT